MPLALAPASTRRVDLDSLPERLRSLVVEMRELSGPRECTEQDLQLARELFQQLGHEEWRMRERATQRLIELGSKVQGAVLGWSDSCDDPEIRLRVKRVKRTWEQAGPLLTGRRAAWLEKYRELEWPERSALIPELLTAMGELPQKRVKWAWDAPLGDIRGMPLWFSALNREAKDGVVTPIVRCFRRSLRQAARLPEAEKEAFSRILLESLFGVVHREARSAFRAYLNHPDPVIAWHAFATYAPAFFHFRGGTSTLLRLAASDNTEIAHNALAALWRPRKHPGEQVLPVLRRRWHGRHTEPAEHAALVAAVYGDKQAVDHICRALKTKDEAMTRRALSFLRHGRALPQWAASRLLCIVLSSDDPDLVTHGIRAVQSCNTADVMAKIRSLLHHRDREVVKTALQYQVLHRDFKALPDLERLSRSATDAAIAQKAKAIAEAMRNRRTTQDGQ